MTEVQLAEKLAEHNPIDRLAPLAKAKVPVFHIHGDSDKVVPLDKNSGELKKRYDKLGGDMTLEVVKGQGHNLWSGWFHSQQLVDFVIAHARGGVVTIGLPASGVGASWACEPPARRLMARPVSAL
jgi:pimeloyl-ACP methyl ester carboxylesterase